MPSPESTVVLRCAFCGAEIADLRAERCASCTRPICATLKRLGVDFDSLAVYTDLACTHCDYNLRTMHIESKCPECGTPIANSLTYNDLAYADQEWLRRVRLGIRCILYSLFVIGPAIVILPTLGPVRGGYSNRTSDWTRFIEQFVQSLFAMLPLLLGIGFPLVTSVEPNSNPKFLARLCRTVGVITCVLTIHIVFWLMPSGTPLATSIADGVLTAYFLAVPVGLIASLLSLHAIAIRVQRPDFQHFMTATIVSILLFLTFVVIEMMTWSSGVVPPFIIITGIICYFLILIAFGSWMNVIRPRKFISSTLRHRHRRDDGE